MPLEPTLVTFALGLCGDISHNHEETEELAVLLGSREELFAYLFVHTSFLSAHPDIREAVETLSELYGAQAVTERTSISIAPQLADLHGELRHTLVALLRQQVAHSNCSNSAHELGRKLANLQMEQTAPQRWIEEPKRTSIGESQDDP